MANEEPEVIQQWLDITNGLISEAIRYSGDIAMRSGEPPTQEDRRITASMAKIRVAASALLAAMQSIPTSIITPPPQMQPEEHQ